MTLLEFKVGDLVTLHTPHPTKEDRLQNFGTYAVQTLTKDGSMAGLRTVGYGQGGGETVYVATGYLKPVPFPDFGLRDATPEDFTPDGFPSYGRDLITTREE